MIRHLYVHIPFCPKVCPYCSFYKEGSDWNKTQSFLDAVLAELEQKQATHSLQPETIFFGGGTPSALSTVQLDYLLTGLRARLDLSQLREWTLEMNPATVSLEKARALRDLGVNRISMGVQSWDPQLLETLGRVHTGPQALRSYEILREAGFDNVNLDLIFTVPGQTLAQWDTTLATTVDLAPEHISAYCLTYEEDTDFFLRLKAGKYSRDPEEEAAFFERTMESLSSAGYEQYEISNYARPGRECLHNIAYWTGADWLGLGPSAFSTIADRRWQNVSDTARYSQLVLDSASAETSEELIDSATRHAETLAFSLRTNRGIPRESVADFSREIAEFSELGLMREAGDRLVLTNRGRMLADHIAGTFV